jgi:hypothetical protein
MLGFLVYLICGIFLFSFDDMSCRKFAVLGLVDI